MKKEKILEVLETSRNELCFFINEANVRLERENNSKIDDAEFYDFQTVGELTEVIEFLKEVNDEK